MKRIAPALVLSGFIMSPALAMLGIPESPSLAPHHVQQVQMSGERSGVNSGIRPGMQTGIRPGFQPGFAGTGAIPGGYGFGPRSAIASGVARGVLPASKTNPMVAGQQPAPGYCWYYTNRSRTRGFWDVCPDRVPRRD
ncbi:hypothetical protein V1291_005332 [Nitrobacteraceae bacterium AZCC 1564]